MLQGSNKPTASVTGVFANARGSVAGGGVFQGSTFQTAATTTAAAAAGVYSKRNQNNPSSALTISNGTTTGSTVVGGSGTRSVRISVGFAQTGGQGGWIAVTPDTAVKIFSTSSPNAGTATTSTLEFDAVSNGASQNYQYVVEWYED